METCVTVDQMSFFLMVTDLAYYWERSYLILKATVGDVAWQYLDHVQLFCLVE